MLKECLKSGVGDDIETDEVKVKQLGNLRTRSKGRPNKRKQKGMYCQLREIFHTCPHADVL